MLPPGHTLSPFTLRALGELEDALARRHLLLAAGAAGGDRGLRRRLTRMALDDVAGGAFVHGAREFRLASMSAGVAPLLLYLSLRVSRPHVTPAEAADLLDASPDPYAVVLQLWDLLGFPRTGEEGDRPSPAAKPPTRPPLPVAPSVLSHGRSPPGRRAFSQAPPARPLSAAEVEAVRRRRQDETFDAIGRRRGLTPDGLAAAPADQLERWVRESNGNRPVATGLLAGWAADYARRRRERPR